MLIIGVGMLTFSLFSFLPYRDVGQTTVQYEGVSYSQISASGIAFGSMLIVYAIMLLKRH